VSHDGEAGDLIQWIKSNGERAELGRGAIVTDSLKIAPPFNC
jgi:hypothetical protein